MSKKINVPESARVRPVAPLKGRRAGTKVFSVARYEYLNAVQSKAFIVGVILMPVMMGGALVVQALLKDEVDIRDRKFAVVDRTGSLFDVVAAAAEERNANEIYAEDESNEQVQPRFLPELATDASGEERVDLALSERVREEDLFGFVIIGANVLEGGDDDQISYYTQTPTFRDLPRWLDRVLNDEIKRRRFAAAGVDRELVDRLNQRVRVERLGLVEVEDDGEVKEAESENELVTFGVPAGAMFLLFMLIMMSAPALLNSVLEEKMQKISEVLVSSVTPFQLMLGKLLATVFVASTLTVLYLGAIVYLLYHFELLDLVPVSIYFWFLLYQLLALLMFGSVFIAIGAACSEIRDAQTLMTPAMLIVCIPLFCWFAVLQAPMSTFSRTISLIPFATPKLMLLRIAIPPGPPWWEIALSVVLTTACALLCVAASAKIFRIGILSQGQTPSVRKLVSWVLSK